MLSDLLSGISLCKSCCLFLGYLRILFGFHPAQFRRTELRKLVELKVSIMDTLILPHWWRELAIVTTEQRTYQQLDFDALVQPAFSLPFSYLLEQQHASYASWHHSPKREVRGFLEEGR